MSKNVFVSYSRRDEEWLSRFVDVLAPVVGRREIELWSDRRITPGTAWEAEIKRRLDEADVAVLLVSTNFLASPFITDVELPAVLRAAQSGDLALAWIAVSSSLVARTEISAYQAMNDPKHPLDELDTASAQRELVAIAEKILAAVGLTQIGRSLAIADRLTDDLREINDPGSARDSFSVTAKHLGDHIRFATREGTEVETVTIAELVSLTPHELRLVGTFERSMYKQFNEWNELYPQRDSLTTAEETRFVEAGTTMCQDLRNILDFLSKIGKNLHDHYGEVDYICTEFAHDWPRTR